MAASATSGGSGTDVSGYTSYLGDEVYGSWRWSDQLGFGIAAEATAEELLAPWRTVRNIVISLAAAVVALVLGLGWYLVWVRPRLENRSQLEAERARRVRRLLDQSSDGICVVTPDHRIAMANQTMGDLFGFERDELHGLEVHRLVGPGQQHTHAALVERFFDGDHPGGRMAPRASDVQATRADGSTFPAEVTLSRIQLDDGEVVLTTVRDMTTDLRALELDRSLRELERITAVAAHDLKEPLRKMGPLCSLLSATTTDDGPDAPVERLRRSAERAWNLVDDLATYIDWSTREVRFEWIDLGELVTEAVGAFRQTIDEAGAEVVVGELPVVLGDRQLLRKLFVELLENALTFRSPDPRLSVALDNRQGGEMGTISVEDNGIGVPGDQLERVFEAFRTFAPDRRRAGASTGNGIGLAICRRIVERHGGSIALTNTGNGTRVDLWLPTDRSDRVVAAASGSLEGTLQ